MKHSFHRTRSLLAFALSACLCPSLLHAQGMRGAQGMRAEPYTPAAAREVIDSMASLLRARYAVADTGALIAAHIEHSLADGRYARVTDWGQFVRLATQDVQSVNQDTHLLFQLLSEAMGPGGPGGPMALSHGVVAVERLDGNVGYMRMNNFLGGQEAFAPSRAR